LRTLPNITGIVVVIVDHGFGAFVFDAQPACSNKLDCWR